MKPEALRAAAGLKPAVSVSLLALLLASCTSAGDTSANIGTPALTTGSTASLSLADPGAGGNASDGSSVQSGETAFAGDSSSAEVAQENAVPAAAKTPPQAGAVQTALETSASGDGGSKGESDATPQQLASATPSALIDGNKREFLSSFLGKQGGKAPPLISSAAVPLGAAARSASGDGRKLVQLASAEAGDGGPSHLYDSDALPGVRQTMLFEIKRKSGVDDESDVDLNEEDGGAPVRVASAAGMARLAPNGLLKQNDTVDTACLKPALVGILRSAEEHFGGKLVITSGYRDPSHNRRVQGAKNSLHMSCQAADVQMAGVSKWELATYFRAMPGRGGVGTYCHTTSVHVDIGPERDWNWKCGSRG